MLGVLDIVGVEVRNREQVEVRENVEARETEEEDKTRETTNAQTRADMRIDMFYADTPRDTLSHNVMCAQGSKCREKVSCEVFLSTQPVGYSGSLSTVNETNCNKKRSEHFFKKKKL